MSKEIWKDLLICRGYSVSNLGNVSGRNGMMRPSPIRAGYLRVNLQTDKHYKSYYVHRLVMLAFVGECPDGHQVNHINGDKSDNRLVNLEYITPKQNIRHSIDVIKTRKKEGGNAKLNEHNIRTIRALYSDGMRCAEIAHKFNVDQSTIWYVISGATWSWVK